MLTLPLQPSTFLFTSESVGEGHPDKIWYVFSPSTPRLQIPHPCPSAGSENLAAFGNVADATETCGPTNEFY
jgi:hypothetical protein